MDFFIHAGETVFYINHGIWSLECLANLPHIQSIRWSQFYRQSKYIEAMSIKVDCICLDFSKAWYFSQVKADHLFNLRNTGRNRKFILNATIKCAQGKADHHVFLS